MDNFNPRAPQGARRQAQGHSPIPYYFNPRAPQGARQCLFAHLGLHELFQSTRSAGSATLYGPSPLSLGSISIHALRRERDPLFWSG